MDLALSDEQRLLRESVDRFITETYDGHRRRVASDPLGFSPEIWQQFADLGWLALPIDETYGGLGAGANMLPIVPEYLNGRAYTIFGGSSEIQRDIVAKMVLGL
jgi:alkylation response protein AidB-like acyl-CoA dehydrogenase